MQAWHYLVTACVAKELYEKLLAKNYDSTNIELVLIDFEKNGWINDEEFGLAFSKIS